MAILPETLVIALRRTIVAIVAFFLLVLAALLATLWLFDPDNHREPISRYLGEALGAPVSLEAGLSVDIYPRPTLRISAARVEAPAGEEGPALAEVRGLELAVRTGPLFQGRLRIEDLRAESVAVHLYRGAEGRANWEPLLESLSARTAEDGGRLQFDGMERARVGELRLDYTGAGPTVRLAGESLVLHDLTAGSQAALEGDWTGEFGDDLRLNGSLVGRLMPEAGYRQWRFSIDELPLQIATERLPESPQPLALGGAMLLDLDEGTLALDAFAAVSGSLRSELTLEAAAGDAGPELMGRFEIADDALRETLTRLTGTEPDTEDPQSLQSLRLSGSILAGPDALNLGDLSLALDDTTGQGHLEVPRGGAPRFAFGLHLDELNVDRYTPEVLDPERIRWITRGLLAALEGVQVDGELEADALTAQGLTLETVQVGVEGTGRVLRADPARADLAGGSMHGSLDVRLDEDPQPVRFDLRLADVDVREVQETLFGLAVLDSELNAALDGGFAGFHLDDILASLEGRMELLFAEGEILGFSLKNMVEDAVPSALGGADKDPFEEGASTSFSDMTGEFTASGGILRNSEARARSGHFRAQGAGELALHELELDYTIDLMLVEAFEAGSERLLEWLEGNSVPLRLHGPLTDLELDVELGNESP